MADLHANHDATEDERPDESLIHPARRLGEQDFIRRPRSQFPLTAHNRDVYRYPPLPPRLPFVRRQGRPVPRYASIPRWQSFLPELPRPRRSPVFMVFLIFIAIAISMVARSITVEPPTLQRVGGQFLDAMPAVMRDQRAVSVPILDLVDTAPMNCWRQRIVMCMHGLGFDCTRNLVIQGFGYFANTLSGINPANAISTILSPIGAISAANMWCKTTRIGCGPDRDAVFRTEKFENLKRPHPSDQISIGTDYFDCLDDLRILRQQEFATSHLTTLAGKVIGFEHLFAAPEDLLNNVDVLAKTWKDVLLKANAARVHGTNGISKIIHDFPRLLDTPPNMTPVEVSDAFSPARDDFATAKYFILTSAQAVKKAQELTTLVSQQAHREMNHLRKLRNEEESGWAYLVFGWTRSTWNYLQPGLVGRKQHSDEAAQFLRELIKVVDESDSPMTRNEMSLQQCALDIAHFSRQVDRDFSLKEASETLSIADQLTKLEPRIESLQSQLIELKWKDQAARLTSAGAPPHSLLSVGFRPSLEGEGAELGGGPQYPAGLI